MCQKCFIVSFFPLPFSHFYISPFFICHSFSFLSLFTSSYKNLFKGFELNFCEIMTIHMCSLKSAINTVHINLGVQLGFRWVRPTGARRDWERASAQAHRLPRDAQKGNQVDIIFIRVSHFSGVEKCVISNFNRSSHLNFPAERAEQEVGIFYREIAQC